MDDPSPWFPIRTARLLLREFRETDSDDCHDYASDPEVSRYMAWGPNTLEDTREFMARKLDEQAHWPRKAVNLAVEHLADHKVIGSVRLSHDHGDPLEADLGYSLHRRYWRRGYGSEAARAVADVAFRALGMHRLFATCDVQNTGSLKVMETLGMQREGLLRENVRVKGAWRNTYLYAVLDREWISPGQN
jgi:ribosomal-protein-alanine N-acetyltransferase